MRAHRDVTEQDKGPVQQQLQLLLRLALVAGTQLDVQELGYELRRPARGAVVSVGPQQWSEAAMADMIRLDLHVTILNNRLEHGCSIPGTCANCRHRSRRCEDKQSSVWIQS